MVDYPIDGHWKYPFYFAVFSQIFNILMLMTCYFNIFGIISYFLHFVVSGATPTEAKLVPGYEQILKSSTYSLQTEIFLQNVAENKCNEPLTKKFMHNISEFCQEHHINIHLNLSGDHPVEEIGWSVNYSLLCYFHFTYMFIKHFLFKHLSNFI